MSIPGQPASDRPSLAPAWLDHLAALGWRVLVTVALAALVIWLALVLSTITASVLIAISSPPPSLRWRRPCATVVGPARRPRPS